LPKAARFGDSVFINCPFDIEYWPIFEAIVFAVIAAGFAPRCALEELDSGTLRLDKIGRLILRCRYGIHDLSRTTLDTANRLPRFNMPLELGVFLGAKRFGDGNQKTKICLILDRDPYRYQMFCSDIAGQDIRAHGNDGPRTIGLVRDWLRTSRKTAAINIPGGPRITERYVQFRAQLPKMCKAAKLEVGSLIFLDYRTLVAAWLEENPW